MLYDHFDGQYLCSVNFKSISYESIDTYFMLPDIGTGIYCY